MEDLLTTDTEGGENGKVLKGITTFDAGEHDFKVNGDLYVADTDGNNKVNVLEKIEEASLDIYSTTERRIGTWIDGKPVYRKVVNTGALPNTTTKNIAHGISNVKRFIHIYGYAYTPNNECYPLPWIHYMDVSYQTNVYTNNTNICIVTGTNRSNITESYVILEYTKSTD